MELKGDCKKGRAIKQLITIEHQQFLHFSIKHHFNSTTKSRLSRIQSPVDSKNWNNTSKDKLVKLKTITDSNVIIKVLIKLNIAYLFQAEGTYNITTSKTYRYRRIHTWCRLYPRWTVQSS